MLQINQALSRVNAVQEYFRQQGTNTYGVLAVLLLVGGDVIQKAMAQQTGSKSFWFTPVAFSFGWVSYAFHCLASAMGSRVYMPPPEHTSWVVNIESGDRRKNHSWLLGRLLRDLELEYFKVLSGLNFTPPTYLGRYLGST